MAENLIDLAKQFLTPDLISKMSGMVGESPSLTQRAMEMVIPSLAGAAAQQAATPSGAGNLIQMLTSAVPTGGSISSILDLFRSGNLNQVTALGSNLLSGLLGGNAGAITTALSKTTGVSNSAVSTLLQIGAPLLMGAIGKLLPAGQLSTGALTSLFASQKESISRQMPAQIAGLFNLGIPTEAPEPRVRPVVQEERRSSSRLWAWLIPVLAVILGLIAWRSCARPTGARMTSLNLPCGRTIQVENGGFDESVAQFMMTGSADAVPKRFTFDHLNFDTNSAQITPDSNTTVSNLITTVQCFPAMQIQLVGYTDNTGSPDANKKLSHDRADAVKALLVRGGVDSTRVSTDGGGQENPIASNDSEEGRAKNRRTELVITKVK